jgi:DNA replicative helicase MCM subunit Mcm2 (Cdc46/Mcm family)
MPKSKKSNMHDKIKKHASIFLKKGAEFGKHSILTLRPLSKEEKFRLNQIRKYLLPKDFRTVQNYLKQGRVKVGVKKLGLSFMVANSDLQPFLESDLQVISKINEIISQKFENNLTIDFGPRAWHITQEYVGGNILGMRNIKKILTLMLFSDKLNVNITTISKKDSENISKIIKSLGKKINISFNSKAQSFDFVFEAEVFDSNRFIEMAEKIIAGEKYKPNENDINFIKTYINKANKLDPALSSDLSDKIKEFVVKLKKKEKKLPYKVEENTIEGIMSLLKASARVDLREQINTKDLDRVFKIVIK